MRPAWGATSECGGNLQLASFNSCAPRGAQRQLKSRRKNKAGFNSCAPRGAQQDQKTNSNKDKVSIHAPRVGRNGGLFKPLIIICLFQCLREPLNKQSTILILSKIKSHKYHIHEHL